MEADLYAADIKEKRQAMDKAEQQALCLDSAEAKEHLARHGMQPNHLFGDELETPTKEATAAILETPTKEATAAVLDLSGDSPQKKKPKSTAGVLQTANQYTTIGFSLTPTAHVYSHPLIFVEGAICLMSEDKPKEFIMAIKLLVQHAKHLDPHFGLAPLKSNPDKPSKIIMAEEDVPSNFTHLGQYAFTSGNRIFKKKKNWKKDKEKQAHRDDTTEDFNDPVVYFTIAIATNLQPAL